MDQELINMFQAMLEQIVRESGSAWVCGTYRAFRVEDLQEKLKELKSNE